jgi:DnaJ-class molecular chaperone
MIVMTILEENNLKECPSCFGKGWFAPDMYFDCSRCSTCKGRGIVHKHGSALTDKEYEKLKDAFSKIKNDIRR